MKERAKQPNRQPSTSPQTYGGFQVPVVIALLMMGVPAFTPARVEAQCPNRYIESQDGTPYGIAIKTGNKTDAGTNGNVFIVLGGSNARSNNWVKVNPPGDSFEKGNWDCSPVWLSGVLEAPLKLAVKLEAESGNPLHVGTDWYLEKVCVSPAYAQDPCNQPTSHEFHFNMWLQAGTSTSLTLATDPPSVSIVPRQSIASARRSHTSGHGGSEECTIRQKSSGRYLDAYQSDGKDYAVVTRPAQGDHTQVWVVTSRANGTASIKQKSSGRDLDAYQSDGKDYAVVTRHAQGDDTQVWLVAHHNNGAVPIRQKSSGRYLDAYQSDGKDYRVVTRSNQGDDTQLWLFDCTAR